VSTPDPLEHLLGNSALPTPLPIDPMPTLESWLADATRAKTALNPNAFALATVDEHGNAGVRIVLCKRLDVNLGSLVFFTNYTSPKARAIDARGRIAGSFFWDHQHRQARFEGQADRACAEESDAYFRSRPLLSRLGAWSSAQSQPLTTREELLTHLRETMRRFGVNEHDLATPSAKPDIPRPEHWGGYHVTLDRVELWVGGSGRLHDRARWSRTLARGGPGGWTPGAWTGTRLQP
jgi:pyridoxamine 5'-phosphate oxidase